MNHEELSKIFVHTYHSEKSYRQEAEKRLKQLEKCPNFAPALLTFTAQSNMDTDARLAASIYFKNVIKYKWNVEKDGLVESDMNEIKKRICEMAIQQSDTRIVRLLYFSIFKIIETDFPSKWTNLIPNIMTGIQSDKPPIILGCVTILGYVIKNYRFVNRRSKHNCIEDIIQTTWPSLGALTCNLLQMYMKNPQATPSTPGNVYQQNLFVLRIVKGVFRIFFMALQMDFPKYLRDQKQYTQWLEIFVNFFKIPIPNDLQLKESMLSLNRLASNDEMYTIDTYSKYANHPYEKCRKWAVRCVTRILELYGRPEYVFKQMKPIAKYFLETYARSFMELFYFGIVQQHCGNYFVYYKTLSPAIRYIQSCVHYGKLFKLLLENNCAHLDKLVFDCMYRIICLNPEDISLWNDNPSEFVRKNFETFDTMYDPRYSAKELISDLVRIRTRYTLDKVLQFSQKVINDVHQVHKQFLAQPQNQQPDANGSAAVTRAKYFEYMVRKDGMLNILGSLAVSLTKAEDGKYLKPLMALIIKHVVPEFRSEMGFLRARACWIIGRFYKVEFPEDQYMKLTSLVIDCLGDQQLPVRCEAASALGRLAIPAAGIKAIKPRLPAILSRFMEIMDDLGAEEVIQLFELLVDRLQEDIIPYAENIMKKLLEMFQQFHLKVAQHVAVENNSENMMRSEEREKEEDAAYENNLLSSIQVLKCVHTLLYSSTTLPKLLSTLEEPLRPLIEALFKQSQVYHVYADDILDIIHAFTQYSNPPSNFMWRVYHDLIAAYLENYPDKFPIICNCLVDYIGHARKNEIPFCSFFGKNLFDELLTLFDVAVEDDGIDLLHLGALMEFAYSKFKGFSQVPLTEYNPRVMNSCMSKFEKSTENPEMQAAMLAVVALVCYSAPFQFMQMLEQKKKTVAMLDLFNSAFKDLKWPQQRVVVYGLSCLLTLKKDQIPPSLSPQRFTQLITDVVNYIFYLNYEEEEGWKQDEEDGDDDDGGDAADVDASGAVDADINDDSGNESSGEESDDMEDHDGTASDLLDVDAEHDYVNSDDVRYLQSITEMTANEGFMKDIFDQWGDDRNTIPRTEFDEMNEVLFFHQCLNEFRNNFPQLFEQWNNGLEEKTKQLLQRHLDHAKQSMADYQKRKDRAKKDEEDRLKNAHEATEFARRLHSGQMK